MLIFSGKKLRELRKKKNLTQLQLAQQAEVSQVALSNWETLPTAVPRLFNIEKVARVLEVPTEYFYIEIDETYDDVDYVYSDEEILNLLSKLIIRGQTNIRTKELKYSVTKEISNILHKYSVDEFLNPTNR